MRYRLVGELLRAVSRYAVIGVVGGLAGACSSDTMRFSENPFANPYSGVRTLDPSATGSVDRSANGTAMPAGRVSSTPLAPIAIASAPLHAQPPSIMTPMPGESYAMSTGGPGWSAEGGTSVTVSQGDSLTAISNRYGVPQSAILSANGVSAAQVAPGKRLIIPIYNASGQTLARRAPKAAPVQAAAVEPVRAAKPVAPTKPVLAAKPAIAQKPVVLASAPTQVVARAPAPKPAPKVAQAAQPAKVPSTPVRIAEARKAVIEPKTTGSVESPAHPRPGRSATLAQAPAAEAAPVKAAAKPVTKPVVAKAAQPEPVRKVAKVEPVAPTAPAKVEPAKPVKVAQVAKPVQPVKPAKTPEPQRVAALNPAKPEPAVPAAKEPEATGALPVQPVAPKAEFRWPARGRVISGFGGTGTNEGINISVPDGTPVKAAEAGTVAYAGSEVKGYGNLVLIRHDNGYVSAYAHNGDLDVKRGQKVTRGQVIAKSGQSGNVTSPQLHFEIRKGATPIDPMPYLASN